MRKKSASMAMILAGIALLATRVYAADPGSAEWECTKDGKTVVVSGNDAAAKQADCEKQGGKWAKKQTAGSSKGW